MIEDLRENALRLLHAVNEHQAHDRTDVTVVPEERDAAQAGLEYKGSPPYAAAVRWLLEAGALQPDYETDARLGAAVEVPEYGLAFKITENGLDMLRAAGYSSRP